MAQQDSSESAQFALSLSKLGINNFFQGMLVPFSEILENKTWVPGVLNNIGCLVPRPSH